MGEPVPLVSRPRVTAQEIAEQVESGQYSAVAFVDELIARIEIVNPEINALVIDCFEQARADARRLDQLQSQGQIAGPLHGVPVSIKECFFIAGTECTIGLDAYVGKASAEDGILVKRLRAAGAIVLGKTNDKRPI